LNSLRESFEELPDDRKVGGQLEAKRVPGESSGSRSTSKTAPKSQRGGRKSDAVPTSFGKS
jgi:hypothetical protein